MEHSELIEAYFRNELSEEEQVAFRARMETDEEFATEVRHYQLITEGIRQVADEADLLEKMERWDQEDKDLRRPLTFRLSPMKIAAAMVPLIIASVLIYFYWPDQATDGQMVFSKYYQPYEDVVTNRTGDETGFAMAMNAYNSQDYEKAIALFDKAIEQEKEVDKANILRLYQAMSYLSVEKIREGEELLTRIEQSGNPMLREVSQWYLLLVAVKVEEVAEAEKRLKSIISDEGHLYQKQARQIKEDWGN